MSGVQIILYILFIISVFCPVYTYVLYPIALKVQRGKKYKVADIKPPVTIVVVGEDADDKIENAKKCFYEDLEVIGGDYRIAHKAKGEIVVFTDTKTRMELSAIREIVQPFADERVGCAVGMQTNPDGNSVFWEYENLVKRAESRIGCVSGANVGLFAVRKSDLPDIPKNVRNVPFFIVTKITENGKDVVFEYHAMTYEGKTEETNFKKHVEDARGYWQSLMLFPRMLAGKRGSFVYVSHRVMKWFVWLNMVMMLVISCILAVFGSMKMTVIFGIQVIGYLMLIIFRRKQIKGPIGKFIGIGYYFVMLNVAYFVGMFR